MNEKLYLPATVISFGMDTGQGFANYLGHSLPFQMKDAAEGSQGDDVKVGSIIYSDIIYGKITCWKAR